MAIDEIGPEPHLVYVANSGSDSVSVIYGSSLMAGVSLNAKPSLGGHIVCNKTEVAPDVYFYIEFHTVCVAEHEKGFQFSSWVQNFPGNLSRA